ncbi:MAG: hypothetical protein OCC46_08725 [Pseudodesulfovibrio sp.]
MDITIIQSETPPPTQYAHTITMVIKSFKGRRDVDIHLFRGTWDANDEARENWDALISSAKDVDSVGSQRVIMESFSDEERDNIINYLKEQYSTRLSAIRATPLTFPVPAGLSGLSQLQPDKSVGFIAFDKIPSYSLDIPLMGLYDLSQHPPIVEE